MNYEDFILEGNKSGDSSLHDWFNKSKSSDGTKGWVQLGGKYAGKPCARQEGQTTKPKCGSSKMKRDLNKKEEDAAFRRKNREDGNPNKSGKAKNVATEGVTYEKFTEEKLLNKMANALQHASLGSKKAQKNPFRNPTLDKQVQARKAAAQDVSKAGKFQDTGKVLKNMQKNIEPVGATSKVPGQANFGKFIATAPGTNAMRGRA